ncbi:MAG: archaeal flagellin N-terminal-like domain [uncultured Acidilobus sp. CIS]|jgi:archaeal flagellin N-terminal-like domain|nr:MAG: archaeal flagellin N-terminal-like domain [uncultured Acidilobus sp. CIS]
MRSRRSISDIVAVVLLIVIAIAAAVIIYMWLSGLMGSMHTSTSVTQVKLEIIGANVTYVTYNSLKLAGYNVTAYVYNPPGSPSTSITLGELEFTNGTLICSNRTYEGAPGHITITPITVTPSGTAKVPFFCNVSQLPPGTPVEIVLITSEGVQVTYTATVS